MSGLQTGALVDPVFNSFFPLGYLDLPSNEFQSHRVRVARPVLGDTRPREHQHTLMLSSILITETSAIVILLLSENVFLVTAVP